MVGSNCAAVALGDAKRGRPCSAAAAARRQLCHVRRNRSFPAAAAGYRGDRTSDCDGNSYAANSTFQANLKLLAAALPVNASASPAGFATAAIGTAPDQANGLALCRGDANATTCAFCVAAAFQDAQQACPLDKGAKVYRDACVLRFAGSRFLDFLREDQWLISELVYGRDFNFSTSIAFGLRGVSHKFCNF